MTHPAPRQRISPFSRPALDCAMIGIVTLIMGGCAAHPTRYPSLLPRTIETRGEAETVAPPTAAVQDPALDTRIAELTIAVGSAKKDFAIAATKATTLARTAKGAAVGSDRWIDAQSALADLDVLRATTSSLVTDIDEATIARAADGLPDYAALDSLRVTAQTELDAQTALIAALQASLPEAR